MGSRKLRSYASPRTWQFIRFSPVIQFCNMSVDNPLMHRKIRNSLQICIKSICIKVSFQHRRRNAITQSAMVMRVTGTRPCGFTAWKPQVVSCQLSSLLHSENIWCHIEQTKVSVLGDCLGIVLVCFFLLSWLFYTRMLWRLSKRLVIFKIVYSCQVPLKGHFFFTFVWCDVSSQVFKRPVWYFQIFEWQVVIFRPIKDLESTKTQIHFFLTKNTGNW